jgi:hypothetical protein
MYTSSYINNNFRKWSIFSIFIGFSSVAEYHINCLCTELSSLFFPFRLTISENKLKQKIWITDDRHSHENTSFSLFGPVELKIGKLS